MAQLTDILHVPSLSLFATLESDFQGAYHSPLEVNGSEGILSAPFLVTHSTSCSLQVYINLRYGNRDVLATEIDFPKTFTFELTFRSVTGSTGGTDYFTYLSRLLALFETNTASLSGGSFGQIDTSYNLVGSEELIQLVFSGSCTIQSLPEAEDRVCMTFSPLSTDQVLQIFNDMETAGVTFPSDILQLVDFKFNVEKSEKSSVLFQSVTEHIPTFAAKYLRDIVYSSISLEVDPDDLTFVNGQFNITLKDAGGTVISDETISFNSLADFNTNSFFPGQQELTEDNNIPGGTIDLSLSVESINSYESLRNLDISIKVSPIEITLIYDELLEEPEEGEVPVPLPVKDLIVEYTDSSRIFSVYTPFLIESSSDYLNVRIFVSADGSVYNTYTLSPFQSSNGTNYFDITGLFKYGFLNKTENFSESVSFYTSIPYSSALFDSRLAVFGLVNESDLYLGSRWVPLRGTTNSAITYLNKGWLSKTVAHNGFKTVEYYRGFPLSLTGFVVNESYGIILDFQISLDLSANSLNKTFVFGEDHIYLEYHDLADSDECHAKYFRWINSDGGWTYKMAFNTLTNYSTDFGDSFEYAGGIFLDNYNPRDHFLQDLTTTISFEWNVSMEEFDVLKDVFTSPFVQMYIQNSNYWGTVLLNDYSINQDVQGNLLVVSFEFIEYLNILQR